MNLENKMVWDLSLEEIEYIYRNLHMDHYIYSALKTYYTSSLPLNRPVCLLTDKVPQYLQVPIEKLLKLSPCIGKDDPSFTRAEITYYTYRLYSVLDQVKLEDVSVVAQLLAACAYLTICSEKNDNLPLWNKPVVRNKNIAITAIIEKLFEAKVDIEDIGKIWFHDEERPDPAHGDVKNLYHFMHHTMFSIIVCMENNEDPQLIERALLRTEQVMRIYELEYGHIDPSSPIKIRDPSQIRYRNTLYLYGGMFFEKQGWYDRAIDWYLKDINVPPLPVCNFLCYTYLRVFKTIERLMSAYRIIINKEVKMNLKDIIHQNFIKAFQLAAKYSRLIIEHLDSHPSIDRRTMWIGPDDYRRQHYAGEPSREGFLISLLYNKFILGIDYRDIDYAQFFNY